MNLLSPLDTSIIYTGVYYHISNISIDVFNFKEYTMSIKKACRFILDVYMKAER